MFQRAGHILGSCDDWTFGWDRSLGGWCGYDVSPCRKFTNKSMDAEHVVFFVVVVGCSVDLCEFVARVRVHTLDWTLFTSNACMYVLLLRNCNHFGHALPESVCMCVTWPLSEGSDLCVSVCESGKDDVM